METTTSSSIRVNAARLPVQHPGPFRMAPFCRSLGPIQGPAGRWILPAVTAGGSDERLLAHPATQIVKNSLRKNGLRDNNTTGALSRGENLARCLGIKSRQPAAADARPAPFGRKDARPLMPARAHGCHRVPRSVIPEVGGWKCRPPNGRKAAGRWHRGFPTASEELPSPLLSPQPLRPFPTKVRCRDSRYFEERPGGRASKVGMCLGNLRVWCKPPALGVDKVGVSFALSLGTSGRPSRSPCSFIAVRKEVSISRQSQAPSRFWSRFFLAGRTIARSPRARRFAGGDLP